MASLSRVIKNLVRWATVSNATDDAGQFPVQQVSYLGKAGDALAWFPYGFHASIPAGELALILSSQGVAEARVAFPGSPTTRPKPIAAGEVVVFHPASGSKIHFKSDGSIEIESDTLIKAVGDVEVTGDLTVSGDTALGATVTSNGVDISDTHVHSGVDAGPSNTGPPV